MVPAPAGGTDDTSRLGNRVVCHMRLPAHPLDGTTLGEVDVHWHLSQFPALVMKRVAFHTLQLPVPPFEQGSVAPARRIPTFFVHCTSPWGSGPRAVVLTS